MPIDFTHAEYSVELLEMRQGDYFVFGDNLLREGKSGQSVIRDCPNAIGVITKMRPGRDYHAYIKDSDYNVILPKIYDDIDKIERLLKDGQYVYWPAAGIGTGRAQLKKRAPMIYDRLVELRENLFKRYPIPNSQFHNLF
ncbi:hypothetical protein P9VFCI_002 [Rhizobium phage P9VFCI]|uniref:DUF7831 domain-containing protein n=2 Tax=Innesvirus TaxID=3044739 RepID=A0A076YLP9_9CAUD|nr:hypothetical protein P10VF_032 [Rhizobium phage vB_RleM_P10VF]YP_010661895.1 hypothetical protein PP937_gp002 [Rhizobium phage P9VFCI]AIK68245.1 hypothetical protein P10VF_032 [Rhizobium phage vB_RleM_P10VF]QNH71887.1 hypothetical protein P9VFCI_002 [Rhizobium phage P9VFCI]